MVDLREKNEPSVEETGQTHGSDSVPRQRIYNAAMRMLAGREHSCTELTRKLARKFSSADELVLDEVIQQLLEQDLVNDQRFVDVLVRSRMNRGYGPFYIQQELKSKGVNGRAAEEVEEWQAADWFAIAESLVERKFTRERCAEDAKIWAKALRLLQRRGFSGHVAYDALPEMPKG